MRRWAVFHAAHKAQGEGRTKRRRGAEIERHTHGARELALDRLDRRILEPAHVGGGKVARDAVHAGAVGAVRRQVDLEHRIVEPGPLRVIGADRRVVGQIDDAFVIVGDLQLEFGDQHAAAFDAADGADGKRHGLAGDEGARRHEHALHAGARIRRSAHHLDRLAVAGIDHAHAQPVGIGMLLGVDHARDDERRKLFALVLDALHLEADHGQLVGDLGKRPIGVEMLVEPGEGKFHHGSALLKKKESGECTTLVHTERIKPVNGRFGQVDKSCRLIEVIAKGSRIVVRLISSLLKQRERFTKGDDFRS